MRITGGQVFDLEQGFVSRDVCFDGEKLEQSSADGKTYDASGCYVIPGLTDLHFHGCVGEDFSDATPDGLQKMAGYELSRGVTQICPAGMTLGEDQLTRICQNAAAHRAKNPGGAELVGLHLEGPFLCKAKKGAQNEAFLHDPDPAMLHRLQQAAQGMVKLVTLAAEQPGALEFIRSAREDGITVSLGHTTADYDTACAAYEAGARQATHLFNAMPPFTHRAPGVVGAAFDHPQVKVELISDGVHIHPAVVRATVKLLGDDKVVLISDSMMATGLSDGAYSLGGQHVDVKGNLATLSDGTIAGSATNLFDCMRCAVKFGVPLESAVRMATINPAKAIGEDGRMGSIASGKLANFVLADRELNIRAVYVKGKQL